MVYESRDSKRFFKITLAQLMLQAKISHPLGHWEIQEAVQDSVA